MDRPLARHRTGNGRHINDIAVVADAHLGLLFPVDALDMLQESMHEMDTELLPLGDDIDTGVFLGLQPDQGSVLLRRPPFRAISPPGRPQLFRLGQPFRFRQAAGDGGRKQILACHVSSPCASS